MRDQILHNPRCTKSRETLTLLREHHSDIPVREYLKEPPSLAELREIVTMLGLRPIDLARKSESRFKELALSEHMDDETVLQLLAQNPVLIERPIVIRNGRAAIGRPPARVLDLL